jgi:hypothetical protein
MYRLTFDHGILLYKERDWKEKTLNSVATINCFEKSNALVLWEYCWLTACGNALLRFRKRFLLARRIWKSNPSTKSRFVSGTVLKSSGVLAFWLIAQCEERIILSHRSGPHAKSAWFLLHRPLGNKNAGEFLAGLKQTKFRNEKNMHATKVNVKAGLSAKSLMGFWNEADTSRVKLPPQGAMRPLERNNCKALKFHRLLALLPANQRPPGSKKMFHDKTLALSRGIRRT